MSDQVISDSIDVTIANGETDSAWIPLKGKQLVALVFPAAMTGASLSFRGRVDAKSGNVVNEKKSTDTYVLSKADSKWIPVDLEVFCGAAELKLVSSATELGDRTFRLITRPLY